MPSAYYPWAGQEGAQGERWLLPSHLRRQGALRSDLDMISIRSRYDLVVLLATDGLPCMRALTTTRARLSGLRSDLVVLRAVMTSDDL